MDIGTRDGARRGRSGAMAVLAGIGAAFLVLGLISGQLGPAFLIGGLSLLICATALLAAPPFGGHRGGCGCGVDRAAGR